MKKLLWLNILILSACGSDVSQSSQQQPQQPQQAEISPSVYLAINEAKENKDYRLMYTLGRNPTIPGFETESFDALKKQCGVKAMSGTGDVLKSPSDKQERRLKYQFAKQYNTKMYPICQNTEHE